MKFHSRSDRILTKLVCTWFSSSTNVEILFKNITQKESVAFYAAIVLVLKSLPALVALESLASTVHRV